MFLAFVSSYAVDSKAAYMSVMLQRLPCKSFLSEEMRRLLLWKSVDGFFNGASKKRRFI